MSLLDPRFVFPPPFLLDSSTLALLTKLPQQHQLAGGKISSHGAGAHSTNSVGLPVGGSFRISDLLDSPSETTSTTLNLSNDAEAVSPRESLESRASPGASPSDGPHSGRGSPLGDGHLHSSGSKKARKARTIFTDKQLQELESTFEKQKYLSVQDRMELAQRMGLTDTQVKTWYQNRRTKWKRQAAVGIDLLNDASNMAAVQQLLRTNPYWANYLAQSPMSRPLLGALGVGVGNPLLASTASPSLPSSVGAGLPTSVSGLPQGFPIPLLSFLPQSIELPKTETPNSDKQE